MFKSSRRTWMKQSAALAAAGGITVLPGKARATKQGKFILSEIYNLRDTERLQLAKQVGVNHVITGGPFGRLPRDQYDAAAKKMVDDFAELGFKVAGMEGHPVSHERIKLGTEGRDEEILNTNAAIEALSKAGVNMICYNFMAGLGWIRTRNDILERGGALTSEFSKADAEALGITRSGEVTEDKMWENIAYFLERVMPVADKWKMKMALHPDDPPLSPLRGIARICTSADNYRRIMNMAPSPYNGITFCQANFKMMGENIYELAREFCEQDKVFFVHFRDVEGTKERFHETFHDNGPTDMAEMIRIYARSGFVGPIRPDHAPTLAGEAASSQGYGMLGKLFAFGYMMGLMDAQNIPYE